MTHGLDFAVWFCLKLLWRQVNLKSKINTISYREFKSYMYVYIYSTYIIHMYSEANTLLCTLLKAVNFGGKGGMLHFYYKEILLFVIGIWNGGLKEKE